jgi:hypothetical protein
VTRPSMARRAPARWTRTLPVLLVAAVAAAGLLPAATPAAAAGAAPPAMAVSGRTAPLDLVSSNPADNTPVVVDGQVQALAEVGGHIVVGGTFTQVRNARTSAVIARTGLFSYDPATGRVDTGFAPVLDGQVDALQAAADGTSVYVAGMFRTVNGTQRAWLAQVDVATGALVTTFSALLDGRVSDLDLRSGTLYAIGWFSTAHGLARGGLAALNAVTGAVDPNLSLPLATVRIPDGVRTVNVTPDRSRMVVAGNFTSVGGVARDQVAVIDLTTTPATVRADWRTTALVFTCLTCTRLTIHTYVRDVAMSADGAYVVIGNTFYYPGNGDAALRFEVGATGSDIRPTWEHWTGTDTITAVTLTDGGAVYIGGHFRWYAAVPTGVIPGRVTRWGLAALDVRTGMPFEWVPTRERGYGVLAMLITSTGDLVIGHDTTFVGGELHTGLAMFPAAGGRTVPASSAPALPVTVTRVLPDGTENVVTWTGSAVSGSANTASPAEPGLRAGFVLDGGTAGERLVGALGAGVWVYRPDAYGDWLPTDRVTFYGVDLSAITALAYQDETLYYTLAGDPNLYARSMNSDSLVVDPYATVVAGPAVGAGRDYRTVRGLFAAGGYLWAGWADGHLDRSPLPAGRVPDTSAAAVTVSGPGVDGQSWALPLHLGGRPAAAADHRPNLARGAAATQSSTNGTAVASRAVDGNRDGTFGYGSVSSTPGGSTDWWQVDLGSVQQIDAIRIWPRTDGAGEWLSSPWVFVSDVPFLGSTPSASVGQAGVMMTKLVGIPAPGTEVPVHRTGRYVRIQVPGFENAGLQLAELEVLGPAAAAPPVRTPGFEVPVAAAGGYLSRPPTVGWRFHGTSGTTTNGSIFTATVPPAPEGGQSAWLRNLGTVEQTVHLEPGDTLRLSATQRLVSTTGAQSIAVYLDGVRQGAVLLPPSRAWGTFTVPLDVAASGDHVLELRGLTGTAGQDRTALVDAVQVL